MNKNVSKIHRIAQYFAIRQISGVSISPDGGKIAYISNTDGLPNIWTIPINGGWTSQITLCENAVRSLSYSPSKNIIAFQSDVQGNEKTQIYLVSDEGGEVDCITPSHSNSQVFLACWNRKGNKILFFSNKRDVRFFDTYVYDIKSKKEELVRESNSINSEMAGSWSSNERFITFEKYYDNSNHDILLFDTVAKNLINITEHTGSMKNYLSKFNHKNDTIYFLSDYKREFTGLAKYNIKSGKPDWEVLEKWDITDYKFSKSEKFLVYGVNENGVTKLKLKNYKSGKTKTLKIPPGNIPEFKLSPDEKKIVVIHDTPQNPNDIFVYDIKKEKFKQITFSMIGGIPSKDFVKPELVKYKSFDGLEISAWLFVPKGVKKDESIPAIVWPHGGPEWQEKFLFNKYFQILTNRGYAVIAPNFRGSTGYGKTFQRLIYRDWGGAEFKDVLAAYDYISHSGYIDKSRIAVVGGSFGGFMTLTCVTRAPERWKCAVDIFGPSNMLTFLNSVPEHWKPSTNELVGNPETEKDFLNERSPINYVDNIRCPLLVIQGKHDPRVVQAESDQMVEKLRSQNKEVEYLVFEDEGHGFLKVQNNIKAWENMTRFLDKHLQ